MPNVEFTKLYTTLLENGKKIKVFATNHKKELLVSGLSLITIDNLRVRHDCKQDRKAFEKNAISQQTVIRKHEAEIKDLKEQADKAREAREKVERLEQIIKNIIE